ncbi:MAG: magnesium chelatase subunit H, partial [Pseudomonadota bacterium]
DRGRARGQQEIGLTRWNRPLRVGVIFGDSVSDAQREPHLAEIEAQWGPAPGRDLVDGRGIRILGRRFGNVTVAVQPGFGYEGDPMRLLFEQGHTPTHAFSAFYRYLRETEQVDALLNFGTHGALEFMPGKQAGLGAECWPERLLGDVPNFYLYAANNPSEGTLAKRRSAATLISYLTPPVTQAGLYRGLADLKTSLDRWRQLPPDDTGQRGSLAELIESQARELELLEADGEFAIDALIERMRELEAALIPHGLHVVGQPPGDAERLDILAAMNCMAAAPVADDVVQRLVAGDTPAELAAAAPDAAAQIEVLAAVDRQLREEHECAAIVKALDGGFIRPVAGGDLLKTPDILPTGRNVHGFDPFRIPSAFAFADGARQAALLLDAHTAGGGALPESVAFVLWGTDNLKSEGGPIAQALALLGARPHLDGYGRLSGAELIPLDELGRPRIDVVMTLSGIFRDLLPQQTQMLAEAAYLAASADEPPEWNYVRKHALAYQQECGCDFETAALRVFSNADGTYGANVNFLVDNGRWDDEDELAEAYSRRKCYAFGRNGRPQRQAELLHRTLADVDIAYQNLESIELGVTTIDHYFDTLGGITRAARRAGGRDIEVYIGDQTSGRETVRTLADQVALETHTRMLNPKWYESLLKHGYEGVRQIETHVTNTMGLSATTGKVAPWVYKQLTETFVLDPAMREQLAALNPTASARMAGRLLEAHERDYWSPDEETLEQLRRAGDELDDRLEGVEKVAVA